jgi:hypothetical protein
MTKYYLFAVLLCGFAWHSVASEIMPLSAIETADQDALSADINMFNAIGLGISLSIAECTDNDICSPRLSKEELQQLIDVLDQRINSLLSRQQDHAARFDLTNIILSYVETKEKYTDYDARLSQIVQTDSDQIDLSVGENQEIFYDIDEQLLDDTDLLYATDGGQTQDGIDLQESEDQ